MATTHAASSDARHLRLARQLKDVDIQVWGVFALLIALLVIVSIASPMFRTIDGFQSVFKSSAFFAILAIGELAVMLARGIDLSIGATVRISAITSAMIMNGQDSAIPLALAASVAIGVAIGSVNAFLVLKLRIEPFIATFAMLVILQGVAFSISTGPVGRVAPSLYSAYTAQVFGIDVINLVQIAFWIVAAFLFSRLAAARRLYAVGGNEVAARLSGIKVNRVRFGSYVFCSVMASLAGMYIIMRSGVAGPTIGDGAELAVITALVIGGVSLMGGRGTVLGVFAGVLLLQTIVTAFDYLQVSTFFQELAKGLLILITVALFVDSRRKT
jgi:ribose transport system permease protein